MVLQWKTIFIVQKNMSSMVPQNHQYHRWINYTKNYNVHYFQGSVLKVNPENLVVVETAS